QLLEDLAAESVHDDVDRVLLGQPALTAVEELVVADLRRRRLVLDARRALARFDVRKRVRAAAIAYQQRIALRVVPRAFRRRHDPHEAAIRVLPVARRDALRD